MKKKDKKKEKQKRIPTDERIVKIAQEWALDYEKRNPDLCGFWNAFAHAVSQGSTIFLPQSTMDFLQNAVDNFEQNQKELKMIMGEKYTNNFRLSNLEIVKEQREFLIWFKSKNESES